MTRTEWLEKRLFPYETRSFDAGGKRLAYVDVGQGEPVVFIHGWPTWSLQWRHLIEALKDSHRCLALDLLGCGLSEKPPTTVYRPDTQSAHLEDWIRSLNLKNVNLVASDLGVPVALSYAVRHPENVRHLTLANGWMWPISQEPSVRRLAKLAKGPLGKWLFTSQEAATRMVMPLWVRKHSAFAGGVRLQYGAPYRTGPDRLGLWGYAKAMADSDGWLQGLWQQQTALTGKPALIVWGMKDPIPAGPALRRWAEVFPDAKVRKFPNSGRFVVEEEGVGLVPDLKLLLTDTEYVNAKPVY